jgi:hypothetical protein
MEDRKIERKRKYQQQIEKEQKEIATKPANTRVLLRKYPSNLKNLNTNKKKVHNPILCLI